MKVYENIVVGNFLYDLGLRIGRAVTALPAMDVNLLQQGPWDQRLADVLLTNSSVCRVIEFKRKKNKNTKEPKKLSTLLSGISRSEKRPEFESVSRLVHWYVEIDDTRDNDFEFTTAAAPYLDFTDRTMHIDFVDFIDSTAKQCLCPPMTTSERGLYVAYLKFLADVNKVVFGNPDAQDSSSLGGLVVAADSNGKLKWIATKDFNHLFMTGKELAVQFKIERAAEMKRDALGYQGPAFGF